MLSEQTGEQPLDTLQPVASRDELLDAITAAREIFVEESVTRYVVALLRHTRANRHLALGASPRSGIALLRLAKARALVERREYVTPDDIREMAEPVLSHRILLAPEARSAGLGAGGCRAGGTRGDARTGVRRRSSGAIALGVAALVASWAFGSTPAAVVGLGFVLAGLFARLWARAARNSVDLERRLLAGDRVEGSDVVVEVRARHRRRLLGGTITLRQRLGVAEHAGRMRRSRTVITFSDLPRGRHELEPTEVVLVDPLGLERIEQRLDERTQLLIRPRIPVLTSVFSTYGSRETGAARSRFRRPTGFEIHAVRDYAPGEPLRAVHWPSTARRGRLMVKELDDAPRDDLAVILDQDEDGVARPSGRLQLRCSREGGRRTDTRARSLEPPRRPRSGRRPEARGCGCGHRATTGRSRSMRSRA